MSLPITSQAAPKGARYGTSAQQEATANKPVTSSASSSSSTVTPVISSETDLLPINRVQAPAKVEKAVTDINQYVQTVSRDLQFSLSEELPLGRAVVKVLDTETKEVIRQFPAEEALAIAERINQQLEDSDEVDSFLLSELI